ncbi:Transcriptional regulator, IclR family protein [Sulfitobacter noctilucae]|uniref:IclR family transcriptional regulator n=1 Tax=Sulfitobacter noctilucae TaxID=1342302 RepID=UPI00046ACF12|nr:IclR family transcriptional regulator [Sulfitobacter noctilucae]KIN70455.1 Transcriptional regulator, IclR family protein [Sulfitobacter noctilucae]
MGTISKALELLNHFSASRSEIGLGEFVRLSQRDKATVHRHLNELEENGFLEQDAASRAYRLGPALLRLAAVREAAFPMRRLLRPIVTELADAVGELAHASLLEGDMLSPLVHADPLRHGTQVHFDEAERLPLHATSGGMAVLAFAEAALQGRILNHPLAALTPGTPTEPDKLREMIAKIRHSGISLMAGSFDSEVISQGAPLFDQHGRVIGALSVAVPQARATSEGQRIIGQKLLAAAHTATRSLGGLHPQFNATDTANPALSQAQ